MNIREIKNPKFLKKMNEEELYRLSYDIREFLIDEISKTGGHLSSNLGVVELTIMLHKVFNFPKDKIIFDVSHQAYTHKILTGRANEFDTLRKKGGLSGFQKRSESIYDNYEAGHSSTSLSAALGFAIARDMNKEDYSVIALIGDGSIGNGLCYEALNQIGELSTPFIIILNDNNMSISENVGAFRNHLDKIRSKNEYLKVKNKTKEILNKVPIIGKPLSNTLKKIKKSIKKLYVNDGFIFEELGIDYYGPINGHDYKELELYLKMAKKPVLIHVITEKGKGYKFSENDKTGTWHGVGAFDKDTGKMLSTSTGISFSEIISNALIKFMTKDMVVITPAMAKGACLTKLALMYPKNFIDVGIAEEHALLLANGLSLSGKIPFVSIYSSFLQRGVDEIIHDIARMNSHVILGIDRCGIVGEDGETHQGVFDLTFLLPIPNMIIATPKDGVEAVSLLKTAINTNSPFAVRYSKSKLDYTPSEEEILPIGSWKSLTKGVDATLITYGDFVIESYTIVEKLKKDNIHIELINARFQKPIDTKMWDKITKKNKPIFVYEESMRVGSLGSYLKSITDSKVIIYAILDEFVPQGTRSECLLDLGLDANTIYENIKRELRSNKNA